MAQALRLLTSERYIRKARLGSGLVIFLFVMMHLSNHALGLLSLHAAEAGRTLFLLVWRNPIGTMLFYGAVLMHVFLALKNLYRRRTLTMPIGEGVQLVTGLMIPLLLIDHVLGTRVVHAAFGYVDSYHAVIRSLWINSPADGIRQTFAVLAVWAHGCTGIHFWLRYRSWYTRITPVALTVAILIPVLALLGFATMGRALEHLPAVAQAQGYPGGYYGDLGNYTEPPPIVAVNMKAQLQPYRLAIYGAFSLALVVLFGLRIQRRIAERAHQISIRYPGGEIIQVPRGFSVLEASRIGNIPHYAVCGGKGQCSTCRVHVVEGADALPVPEALEQRTLKRIGAAPAIRLACQLRPTRDIAVVPLLVPMTTAEIPGYSQTASPGREREIVVLFCDLRHFTTITEQRLPFDIVFLLNRYFAIVGRAVEDTGGRLDKFIGDGAMALFGLNQTPEQACKQALRAAAIIIREVDHLSNELAKELSSPLSLAIGIHAGPAVVGSMGYGTAKTLTAVGDTVNVASRLESVAKEFEKTLVFSEPVANLAGADLADMESQEIAVRGRALPLRVFVASKEELLRFA